jgi:hypothetical protein
MCNKVATHFSGQARKVIEDFLGGGGTSNLELREICFTFGRCSGPTGVVLKQRLVCGKITYVIMSLHSLKLVHSTVYLPWCSKCIPCIAVDEKFGEVRKDFLQKKKRW